MLDFFKWRSGIGAALPNSRPSNPFGEKTVTDFPDPLVKIWNTVREQIQLDDLIVSSCIENETDDCAAAEKLMSVVKDARQYQGRAVIGHINRSINLMIKPSAGDWMSALDILKLGRPDCKDYTWRPRRFALWRRGRREAKSLRKRKPAFRRAKKSLGISGAHARLWQEA